MVYLQGWLKDRFSGSSVFLMTFHASNNEFSQFSLQYEPSTINKSSSCHLCLETFSNILTIPPALSRQWVCYQTIAGATDSKWFWEKQQTYWLGFFRQYVVLQPDYLFRSGETSSTYMRTRCKRCKQLLYILQQCRAFCKPPTHGRYEENTR